MLHNKFVYFTVRNVLCSPKLWQWISLVELGVHDQFAKVLSTNKFYPNLFAVQSSQSTNVFLLKCNRIARFFTANFFLL